MSVKRFVAFRTDKTEFTAQGFLRLPATLTRIGVFKYRKADGTFIRELRHPDDVFNADSLASLQMAPVTDDHPREFVTPANVKKYSVGWISENIKSDDRFISTNVIVADADTIRKVDAGKREVSCGYHADLVPESGVYDGEEYDYRQTNIRYNHVAIVDRGRAGPLVRLRMDSEDAVLEEGISLEIINDRKGIEMEKELKIDGKTFKVPSEVFDAFEASKKEKTDAEEKLAADSKMVEDLKAKVKDLEEKLKAKDGKGGKKEDASKEDISALQAKIDHLEEKLANQPKLTPKEINDAVEKRLNITKVAKAVLGEDAKLDGKEDLDVMKEVITKHSPKVDLKDKEDVYVKARFDAIAEDVQGREERRYQIPAVRNTDTREDGEFDSKKAREKALKEDAELWKKPLATSKAAN